MKKSLLDIQQEIRALEHKIKEISLSVAAIDDEIGELRNDDTEDIDYKKIRVLASHFRFGEHPLVRLKDTYVCRMYIETLLSLTQADGGSDSTISRLAFIQWILGQTSLEIDLEDLFKESMEMTKDSFVELAEVIPKHYKNQLIVDALIIANICGQASSEVFSYVADLCSIFDIDKEQIQALSIIAMGVLKQDFSIVQSVNSRQVIAQSEEFKHYLSDELCKSLICAQRKIVVEIEDKNCAELKWCVKQQGQVEKGDIIVEYSRVNVAKMFMMRGKSEPLERVKAPCAGTLFRFRSNNVYYGIISDEADNMDSIKAWVLKQK